LSITQQLYYSAWIYEKQLFTDLSNKYHALMTIFSIFNQQEIIKFHLIIKHGYKGR